MSGTSLVMGVYIVRYGSRFWILTIETDPQKSISPVVMGHGRDPGLSVCLYGLPVCGAACLLRV